VNRLAFGICLNCLAGLDGYSANYKSCVTVFRPWSTLEELPKTLDETYKRVLKELKKPNRVHTIRLLQCLVVAIRSLRVEAPSMTPLPTHGPPRVYSMPSV
jgi:hypothetical protein